MSGIGEMLANLVVYSWIGCILFGLGTIIYYTIKDYKENKGF